MFDALMQMNSSEYSTFFRFVAYEAEYNFNEQPKQNKTELAFRQVSNNLFINYNKQTQPIYTLSKN